MSNKLYGDLKLTISVRTFQEGITILVKCEEAAEILETKIMEYRQESEVQLLIKELVVMKTRIQKLLTQARDGINIIQVRKVTLSKLISVGSNWFVATLLLTIYL